MKQFVLWLAVLGVVFLLAGCSSQTATSVPPTERPVGAITSATQEVFPGGTATTVTVTTAATTEKSVVPSMVGNTTVTEAVSETTASTSVATTAAGTRRTGEPEIDFSEFE